MMEQSSFGDAVRAVADELREGPYPPTRLNRAASRIDQLGRRLSALGWVRDREIGGCLSSAVQELSQARGLPEAECAASVRRAILQLEAALGHAAEGLVPIRAAPKAVAPDGPTG